MRKAVEVCRWGLTGHFSRSLKDSSAEGNVDSRGPFQEVSRGEIVATRLEIIPVIFWGGRNMAAFCPCPKNYPGLN